MISSTVLDKSFSRQKKTRNYWLKDAHEHTFMGSLDYHNAYGQYDELRADAVQYINEVKDSTIILQNTETGKLLKIPYVTRFSSQYDARQIKKLRKVAQAFPTGHSYFWTLTLDPSHFSSLHDMHVSLSRFWNKFATAIRKAHKRFDYIKIVETQKSGMLHIHFVTSNYLQIDEVRKLWHEFYRAGLEVNVQRVYDHAGVAHYLFKYLKKSLDTEVDYSINLTKLILWALYARTFSVSRALLDNGLNNSNSYYSLLSPSLNDPTEKGLWQYLGAVPNSVAELSDSEILAYLADIACYV